MAQQLRGVGVVQLIWWWPKLILHLVILNASPNQALCELVTSAELFCIIVIMLGQMFSLSS